MIERRYGTLAVLLHLIAPGLGFLYSARPWAALVIPFFMFSTVFFIGWSRLILQPWGLWLIWAVLIAIYLLLIPLVFLSARRCTWRASWNSQRTFVYVLFTFVLLLLVTVTVNARALLFGYETFIVPSKSMANTLLPNDYIIVDTWAYKEHSPQQGDILVFKYPLDPTVQFIKRMVAGSGDHLVMSKTGVSVNSRLLSESYVLSINNQQTKKQRPLTKRIPENHYFVLGDNRDHSNDSRRWGYLEEKAIYGKAVSIWFSFSAEQGVRMARMKKLN